MKTKRAKKKQKQWFVTFTMGATLRVEAETKEEAQEIVEALPDEELMRHIEDSFDITDVQPADD